MRVGRGSDGSRRWVGATALTLLVGFLAGMGVAWVGTRGPQGAQARQQPVTGVFRSEQGPASRSAAVAADAIASTRPAAQPDADTAAEAVDAFLSAEAAGDFAGSYRLLSRADQRVVGSRAAWIAAHAHLPPLVGHRLGTVSGSGDRVEMTGEVRLRAGLDEVAGLVPARAVATWVAVAERGGWRVAYGESRLEPIHPPSVRAAVAVRRWAEELRSCRRSPIQHRSGLLGAVGLAGQLCGAPGAVRLGTNAPLADPVDAAAFVAAYGAEATEWARVIRVEGPVALRVVAAPVGDDWQVIGVLEAR